MIIGSLFSGIGGLELGLERAIPNASTAWQVEADEYARTILAKHWPNARRYNDVREVGAHNLGRVDIICGGFPCQDISAAGKREGITGRRSGLWTEYARIVRELRPRFVVVENVAALRIRGMGTVLGDLAACGYDAVWDCVPAAAVGAPHRRDRLFIVAWSQLDGAMANPDSGQRPHNQLQARRDVAGICGSAMADADGERQLQQSELCREKRGRPCDRCSEMADANGTRLQRQRKPSEVGQARAQEAGGLFRRSIESAGPWKPEPQLGRVAHGIPNRVDRLRALGNAVVPQVAEVIGRVIVGLDGGGS